MQLQRIKAVPDLIVGERQAELLDTALDRVPAGQTVPDRDVTRETEVLGLEDFVRRGVVKDRLRVDASLVRERAVSATYDKIGRPGSVPNLAPTRSETRKRY